MNERRRAVAEVAKVELNELTSAASTGGLDAEAAEHAVENALGIFALPFAAALNLRLNGRDVIAPMVTEEPSVVAAASYAARLAREGGGFEAEADAPLVAAQVQLCDVPDLAAARERIEAATKELLALADACVPGLVSRGGGARELGVRALDDRMLVTDVLVDVRDAMGANLVNAVAEGIGARLAELSQGRVGFRVLSNLCDRRRVRVRCRVPFAAIDADVARRICEGARFAELDVYRATTHNKGIMNGVDAVALATGNDFRAVEAAAHAYAARDGRYRPLSTWALDDVGLVGRLELPLALGTVGRALAVSPSARVALKLTQARSSGELAMVAATVGLATNLAALRALACEGIRRGHLELHARSAAARRDPRVQRVTVTFEYPVQFTRGVFDASNPTLREVLTRKEPERRHRVLLVLDSGLCAANPGLVAVAERFVSGPLELAGPALVVPGGEACKNDPGVADGVVRALHERSMDRHAFVVAAGGGAVLDMAGWAAGITHRGVRLVRLPSTTLAQADSGVGVKNGINAFGKKNFLGTFVPPFAVVCDSRFLETQSARDRIAGMAEAVKVAAIRDGEFFGWIAENAGALREGDAARLAMLVQRSAELHLRHIATSGDPFELGSARPLDFGHWAAHKLESMTQHRLRHGEAVALGLALDAAYSAAVGLCDEATAEQVAGTLEQLGFTLWDEALERADASGRRLVLDGAAEFREHLGGELTVTLLQRLGAGVEVHTLDEAVMSRCIEDLKARRTR